MPSSSFQTAYTNIDASDKVYKTIGEVEQELDIPQHILRFWEEKFSVLKPVKRYGNRRYYTLHDILVIKKLKHLLYVHKYTIKGVQNYIQKIKTYKKDFLEDQSYDVFSPLSSQHKEEITAILKELENIKKICKIS